MPMTWLEAIERVLKEEARPLRCSEISELILSKGYYKTEGATPDATVSAQITNSIKQEGEKSPFLKVSRGIYTLRDAAPQAATTFKPSVALPPATPNILKAAQTATPLPWDVLATRLDRVEKRPKNLRQAASAF